MGIINQLDYETANLVAAGEVIDRPASIVKELIENSIDAGATRIVLEIKNGGISFIRVTDNGKGMAREDVPISILRHATSKIKTGADLNEIMTLGFRGEALASVAAVAKLRIRTKRPEDEMGTELFVEPGSQPIITEAGMSDGTTIIVEELFANVPARRKFLKKDQTEANAVQAVFEKIALSCPHISMTLIVDNWKRIYTVGDGKLEHTIYGVMGSDFSGKLIEVKSADPSLTGSGRMGIRVHGFIGTPDNARSNRNHQCFFVNGRFVKSRCLYAALEQAYSSYIASEKYPACVLFVEMPPSEVDVNVHPTKLEVKFANEKEVFESMYYTVRGALETKIPRPLIIVDKKPSRNNPINAFVPIDDKSEPVERKSVYNNQRNVKRGQISWADLINKPTEQEPQVPSPHLSHLKGELASSINNEKESLRQTEQEPSRYAEAESSQSADAKESAHNDKLNKAVYETVEVKSPEDIPKNNVQTNYWAELPRSLDEGMTARYNRKTTQAPPQQMVLGELPTEVELSPSEPHQGSDGIPSYGTITTEPKPHYESRESDDTIKTEPQESKSPVEFRIIGEAFLSYVFVEVEDKVLIIDKHAAHERIIFEELRANRSFEHVGSQIMLVPIEVTLSGEEMSAICDYEDDIRALGFEFGTNDMRRLTVSAIPIGIEASAVPDMIVTIADRLANGTGNAEISRDILFDKALYQAACKAAIKAGRDEDIGHIKWIINTLLTHDYIKVCPHGRPVAFELTKSQIERQFKRS